MKIAFVVQRYGADIVGGAEYLTRLFAEHLIRYHDIEVLTTCAKSYHTWENEYPEGTEIVNGIPVRRFRNTAIRTPAKILQLQERVFYHAHSRDDELRWIEENGPVCPGLITYLKKNADEFDCVIFFTFRYYQSYHGVIGVGKKAIIVPFAEDDPALDLATTKEIFSHAAGVVYSTPEERTLIRQRVRFDETGKIVDVVGSGIETPGALRPVKVPSEYILYLGRIEGSKGCYTLFEFYRRMANEMGSVPYLVLAGQDAIGVPRHKKIVYLGFVSEEEKASLLHGARFLIMPSPYESLSLVTLEAMGCGTPVLVNGECSVLKGHCVRSNAGLWYQDYDEFKECTRYLLENDRTRVRLGENGKRYVESNYQWDRIEQKFLSLLRRFQDLSADGSR
ncbi:MULTISPECIES: glycosyltransferase family 4 protein [unclassified Methanoculleus]|jgi:glycosyltransferase involved in cell wall biosynthesis|uniref:glycosyltransferase family 4 protein n=1 Tax=unclassified Methanoculleus TaxID=2619537 RepID=UPI0025EEA756|nr:glycosyltransferase family 4 protein [Methanoculleus sp. UBA377]